MKSVFIVLRLSLMLCMLTVILTSQPRQAFGQAGLREALERLDRDEDGEVEPEEITPLARPYLERIMRASRMSIDRDNDIDDLQEAARRYYAQQNGSSDRSVRARGESTVKPFGTDDDEPMVPEFGLPEVKYPYTQDDLDFADRTLRSNDRNRDGYIDRREATRERWTHRNPFDDDLNKDERLSRLELAQRYARRRLLDQASDELRQKAWRTGGEAQPSNRRDGNDRRDDSQWWRSGGSSFWLTASVLGRFDLNKNGRLEAHEQKELGIPIGQIDIDRDGEVSRTELHAYLAPLQEEAGQLAEGIPGWFYELDADDDRQVSMSEFISEWTEERMTEFTSLDLNADGLLTADEVARSKAMIGGSYTNLNAEVLPPGRTVISEIEVSEDYLIGDLNVQLSITHSNVSHLDAFLTGPDGQRIELFTEVGGRDNNFEATIFDDQATLPIVKARPPFKGTFLPEAALKREPSLSHFTDKSVQGVWQLVIRGTRSDRFGMLHSWSLLVRPLEQMPGQTAGVEADGPQAQVESVSTPVVSAPDTQSQTREESPRISWSEPSRPAIDYEGISRRMQEAVKAGKMTEDQVREAWIEIKSKSSDKQKIDKQKVPAEWKQPKRSIEEKEAMRRERE